MLGEWPEATEAALLAEYGRDVVGEFWRREISLRTLRVMVEHLPPGSAKHRAEHDGWAQAEHFQATLIDLANANYHLALAKFSGGDYQSPTPIERPGDARRRAVAEAAARKQIEQARAWMRDIEATLT